MRGHLFLYAFVCAVSLAWAPSATAVDCWEDWTPPSDAPDALVGDLSGDTFGWDVAVSGNGKVFAVGAPGFNGPRGIHYCKYHCNDAGLVRTYRIDDKNNDNHGSMTVTKIGQDLLGHKNDIYFGLVLSLNHDGTRLAVGAPGSGGGVFVYDWNDELGMWVDNFVCYYWFNSDTDTWENNRGCPYDFDDETNPFKPQSWDTLFGLMVRLDDDGNTLAISEAKYGVHVLRYSTHTKFWSRLGQTLIGTDIHIEFGRFIDLSRDGRTLVVGSTDEGFYASGQGDNAYAQMYQYNNHQDAWVTVGDPLKFEFLMTGLALADNQTIAIATSNEAFESNGKTKVRVLQNTASDNITFQEVTDVLELPERRYSRHNLDISGDGKTLVVGHNEGGATNDGPGDVSIYRLTANKRWELRNYFWGDNEGDYFGKSVAISRDGGIILAGANGYGGDSWKDGYVKLYGGVECSGPSTRLSMLEVIAQRFALQTFEAYLVFSGLLDRYNGPGPFIFMIPWDGAFDELDTSMIKKLQSRAWNAHLQNLVENHISEEKLPVDDLPDSVTIMMQNEASVTISRLPGTQRVHVNDILVLASYDASNGFAYMLDNVLVPEWMGQSLLDVVNGVPSLVAFASLVVLAELESALSDMEGNGTVLAPTNTAFRDLGEDIIGMLVSDMGQAILRTTLLYHVIVRDEGPFPSLLFRTAPGELETLAMETLVISPGNPPMVHGILNEALVVGTDLVAHNGVAHLIDTVLLPEAFVV